MTWIAAAVIAGPIIGGLISGDSSQQAAQTQAGAANQASANTMSMFNTQQANIQPWLQAGQGALGGLQGFMGTGGPGSGFNAMAPGVRQFDPSMLPGDPSYQWRLGQGQNAILNNMSAMGGTFSGNTARALQDYTQGLASTQYQTALGNYTNWQNNVFNRLSAMSGTGVNAGMGVAGLGMNAVGNANATSMMGANNLATGQLASTGALVGGANTGINNWMLMNMLQNQGGGGGVAGTGANTFDQNLAYWNTQW